MFTLVEKCTKSIYSNEILEDMQKGIQYRIGSTETPKLVQSMGLLIWKQYAEKIGINLKDGDQGEDELTFEEITADIIFKPFIN
jgi:hypothetical protein